MLALNFLRVAFAWAMHVGIQMPGVGAPMIRVVAGQPEGLEQRFELQKDLVCAAPEDICQDFSCVVIDGMPQPTWIAFVTNKRPHLIHLRFTSALQIPGHLGWVQRAQQRGVHRLQRRFFLLEFTQYGVGTNMQRASRIAYPTGIEAHVDDRLLDFRQAPSIAIIEQKTALGTEVVLAWLLLDSRVV